MTAKRLPRVLGIDDGPFVKGQREHVPIVGVVMAGPDLVEGVALSSFPVDGDHVTEHLRVWIRGSRWQPALQGIVLGGITIAGLGLVDLPALADDLKIPVLAVTRREPRPDELTGALIAAGLPTRLPVLERSPPSVRIDDGLHLACAGADETHARALLASTLGHAKLPEPLRLAHLIGTALVRGQSQGRV